MFGLNPIRKVDHHPEDGKLAVQEVFYTIQGEGPFSGVPAVFVRLAGCHLACTFCDTEFESNIDKRYTPTQVAELAWATTRPSAPLGLVVLTGGEPLRQSCGDLVGGLISKGFTHVQIETAGNLWDPSLKDYVERGLVSLVCSPKTPMVHPMIYRWCDHWKYVISAGEVDASDGLPSTPTQKHQPPSARPARPWDVKSPIGKSVTIWVSPCDSHVEWKTKANTDAAVASAMRYGYRLSLQTHKMLGLP